MALRRHLGDRAHQLARQKDGRLEQTHLPSEYLYMRVLASQKSALSRVVCSIKGKSASHAGRVYSVSKVGWVRRRLANASVIKNEGTSV